MRVLHRTVGVRRLVGQDAADEAVAQRILIRRKTRRFAEFVAREAIGEHGQILGLHPRLHRRQLVGRDMHSRRIVERQRGLREHRREHRGLKHHRQREIAGKAHADRPDALAAAFFVRERRERAQPLRRRRAFIRLKSAELAADAPADHREQCARHARHRAVLPEDMRHIDGEARIADPAREPRDMRADPRHFGHHDHRRAAARHIDEPVGAEQADHPPVEIVERIVAIERTCRHAFLSPRPRPLQP